MLRMTGVALSAAAGGAGSAAGPQSAQVLHSLYRRLRKEGEERAMIERALTVRPLEANVRVGLSLLHSHTALVDTNNRAREVPFWRIFRRLRLAFMRRYYAWRIFSIRLALRSTAAISDALVYTLFLVVCFMLYQMYRVCRIGVTRAEERYRTMAIPIQQTFEAIEQAHARKKKLRDEMEGDILRER